MSEFKRWHLELLSLERIKELSRKFKKQQEISGADWLKWVKSPHNPYAKYGRRERNRKKLHEKRHRKGLR